MRYKNYNDVRCLYNLFYFQLCFNSKVNFVTRYAVSRKALIFFSMILLSFCKIYLTAYTQDQEWNYIAIRSSEIPGIMEKNYKTEI